MKLEMCAVYDSKARAFMPPFFVPTLAVAVRAFAGAARQSGTPVGDHPEDFTLYSLGTFDDDNAVCELHAQPMNLGMAANLVKREAVREHQISMADSTKE